jgi:hypothetical protein
MSLLNGATTFNIITFNRTRLSIMTLNINNFANMTLYIMILVTVLTIVKPVSHVYSLC